MKRVIDFKQERKKERKWAHVLIKIIGLGIGIKKVMAQFRRDFNCGFWKFDSILAQM